MDVNWSAAWAAGQKTATVTAPSVAAATPTGEVLIEAVKASTKAASTTATSTSATSLESEIASIGIEIEAAFKSIVAKSNSLKAFGDVYVSDDTTEGNAKIGNIGVPEGSNMIFVDTTTGYDFTNTFINTSGSKMTIVVWNKAATPKLAGGALPDAFLGPSIAPLYAPLVFTLAAGAKQIVAFDNNTQNGWAQATTELTKASQFATSWGEGNFVSTGSGYDLSAIQNPNGNNYNMAISSEEASCISDPTQNYWLTDSQSFGSGSCYIAQSTAHLTTKMGGSM